MNPFLLNTKGELPCRTPLKMNTGGELGSCGPTIIFKLLSFGKGLSRSVNRGMARGMK